MGCQCGGKERLKERLFIGDLGRVFIIDGANSVISNNKSRKAKKIWTANEAGEKINYTRTENDKKEEITEYLNQNLSKNFSLMELSADAQTSEAIFAGEDLKLFAKVKRGKATSPISGLGGVSIFICSGKILSHVSGAIPFKVSAIIFCQVVLISSIIGGL